MQNYLCNKKAVNTCLASNLLLSSIPMLILYISQGYKSSRNETVVEIAPRCVHVNVELMRIKEKRKVFEFFSEVFSFMDVELHCSNW